MATPRGLVTTSHDSTARELHGSSVNPPANAKIQSKQPVCQGAARTGRMSSASFFAAISEPHLGSPSHPRFAGRAQSSGDENIELTLMLPL
jgi:hypothetical protein